MRRIKNLIDALIYFFMVILLQKIVYYCYCFFIFKIAEKIPTLIDKWIYSDIISPEEKALEVISKTQTVPILISWVLIISLIVLAFFLAHQNPFKIIIGRIGFANLLLAIIIGFGTVIFTNGIASTLNFLSVFSSNAHYNFDHNYFFGTIIVVGIIMPIFEEIVFRGFILNKLSEAFSKGVAIFIQALLFSVSHLDLVQGITIFPLGIIGGYTVIKTKSIISGIVIHGIFNITNLYLYQNNHNYYNGGQLIILIVFGLVLTYFGIEKTKYVR